MSLNGLRQWWTRETQKIKALLPEQRGAYVWEYYKLWIIAIVTICFVLIWGVHQYVTTKSENWFFACFANTQAQLGEGSEFWANYADYAGYDLNEKNLVFNDRCYCDPGGSTSGSVYYQMLIAYLDSGDLDVLVIESDRLQVIGSSGRLMDLEDERMKSVFQRYADRLIYCEPMDEGYGKELVPIGIDLSGTALVGENCAYSEGAALGVNALTSHPEQVEIFLAYLFDGPGD